MARGAKTPGSFAPGTCGNPGGRPAGLGEVREAAKCYTLEALDVLARCMRSKKEAVAMAAADKILDRAWGKPAVSIGGSDDLPAVKIEDITDEARLRALGLLLAKANGVK
jgi:hypothetical protein